MGAAKKNKLVEDLDTLEPMLTRLKLTAIRDQLDTLLDQAGRSGAGSSYFWAVLKRVQGQEPEVPTSERY